jgi:hypothetical protein
MSEPTDLDNDDEAFAEATLTQAIENQIESGEPPAAKATYNKLTLVGYEREDILNLMAHVLAFEIDNMLVEDRAFNGEWYENALRALPGCRLRWIKARTNNPTTLEDQAPLTVPPSLSGSQELPCLYPRSDRRTGSTRAVQTRQQPGRHQD